MSLKQVTGTLSWISDEHRRPLLTLCAQKIKQMKMEQAHRHTEYQLLEINRRVTETKLLALRMQMNPHFIFNCLSSINSVILQKDVEQASDLLTKFSRLMRQVLENAQTDWVSLRQELNALQIYLELEQLRCDKKIAVQIDVDANIDQDMVHVPPLITQPYVENAIWQGLLPMKEGTPRLLIKCRLRGDQLVIQIQDNGVGRVTLAQQWVSGLRSQQQEGSTLMAERLQLINELYEANAQIAIVDQFGANGLPAGVCVTFTLNLF